MPDSRGEARCPRCGEMVLPAIRKLCAGCGADVTRAKRTRDEAGEYYCLDCWSARADARGEAAHYRCHVCGGGYPSDQVYQDGEELICRGCYDERQLDPNALLLAAAEASGEADVGVVADTPETAADAPMPYLNMRVRKRQQFPWGLVSALILLTVLLVLAGIAISR
ncbi:MAG TPA: hypothetical protein VF796_24420 [Humisphaera sp.]